MPSGWKLNGEYSGKVFQKGVPSWSKGLKAKNYPKLAKALEMAHASRRGCPPWNKENLSIKCIICNKEFKINRYAIEKSGRKCCSRECFYQSRKGKSAWNKGKNNITKICKNCGKEFTFWESILKKSPRNYCSKDCYNPPLIQNCIICSKEFRSSPSDNQKCCSFSCFNKNKIGKMPWDKGLKRPKHSGKNSPNWKGGITPVNKAIRMSFELKQWRIAVFERDNYTCIKCKSRNGNGKKIILHADHIKRFSDFPELRLDINNGQTLCKNCHLLKTKEEGKLYWKNQFNVII